MGIKITIELPDSIVEQYKTDYEELMGEQPSPEKIVEFFTEDMFTVYENIATNDGFLDAIG